MFYEPPPTQADLHFRLFGIPVRIHPWFWVITALLGLQGASTPPLEFVAWVAVVLVSILVHELGHAFVQRYYGGRPRIVLHGMGGLAIAENHDRSTTAQVLISLAGPLAGFAFAIAVLFVVVLSGHGVALVIGKHLGASVGAITKPAAVPILGLHIVWQRFAATTPNYVLIDLLWVNLLWGMVNLLPIYPLDGGRIARELLLLGNPRQGIVFSLQLSLVAAGAMAVVGLVLWQSLFTSLVFGYLAFSSYQTLLAYRAQGW
jgi:membrane-associated protease RseP (regulator of RpoE activity)